MPADADERTHNGAPRSGFVRADALISTPSALVAVNRKINYRHGSRVA